MPRTKIANKTEEKIKKVTKSSTAKAPRAAVEKPEKSARVKKEKNEGSVKESMQAAVQSTGFKKRSAESGNLTIDVYGIDGKVNSKLTLPAEIFGGKVNRKLIAQAVRVYLANKRQGTASTKTRGEVDGSSRKIYRQKGTGRARHGSIRAPIFVKGGIVHGPKPRDFSLDLPKKMRKKALRSALAAKLSAGEIKIVAGFESIEPKTKQFFGVLQQLGMAGKKRNILFITPSGIDPVKRACRNIAGLHMSGARQLNALAVLRARQLLFMRQSIEEMEDAFKVKSE